MESWALARRPFLKPPLCISLRSGFGKSIELHCDPEELPTVDSRKNPSAILLSAAYRAFPATSPPSPLALAWSASPRSGVRYGSCALYPFVCPHAAHSLCPCLLQCGRVCQFLWSFLKSSWIGVRNLEQLGPFGQDDRVLTSGLASPLLCALIVLWYGCSFSLISWLFCWIFFYKIRIWCFASEKVGSLMENLNSQVYRRLNWGFCSFTGSDCLGRLWNCS